MSKESNNLESLKYEYKNLISLLKDKNIQFTDSELNIVLTKIVVYLRKTGLKFDKLDLNTLSCAIEEFQKQLLATTMGIAAALEAHQKSNSARSKKQREKLATHTNNFTEILIKGEDYSLFRLNNIDQLKQESKQMGHCIGNSEHYIKKIIEGDSEIWSFRSNNGDILVTIEYDLKSKNVLQIKKKNDLLLHGEEDFFKDLIIFFAKMTEKGIPINTYLNTKYVKVPDNSFINMNNEIMDINKLLNSNEKAFKGNVTLSNDMDDDLIRKICNISNITVNTTSLNQNKKDIIVNVVGSVQDESNLLFNNLKNIGCDAIFENSTFTELNSLQSIGGDAMFKGSQISKLNSLRSIGGDANFMYSKNIKLNSLENVGGNATFYYSDITELNSLKKIGGEAMFRGSKISKLNSLKSIGGNAIFEDSIITELSSLQKIGGEANFRYSKNIKLDSLENVGGNATFYYSKITKLNSLKRIGGNATFEYSEITELSSLQEIGGRVLFDNRSIKIHNNFVANQIEGGENLIYVK